MEKLEEKGYPIYFVDIDEGYLGLESHQIRSVPTIKIVEDEEVLETMIGIQDPETYGYINQSFNCIHQLI